MGVKVWIFSKLLLKFQKQSIPEKKHCDSFMTPHSSLMKSDKQFNKDMNISSHVLIFGAVFVQYLWCCFKGSSYVG